MDTKLCKKCNITKPLSEFYFIKKKRADSTVNKIAYFICKECTKAANAERKERPGFREQERLKRIERRKDPKVRNREKAINRRSYLKNKWKQMWYAAKYRAHIKGIEFTIIPSDIIIPEYCPILEVKLEVGKGNVHKHSPSLDRIDNTKGYIKGNIWVISRMANTMKNSATLEELYLFCTNMLKIYSKYDIVRTVLNKENTEVVDKEPHDNNIEQRRLD